MTSSRAEAGGPSKLKSFQLFGPAQPETMDLAEGGLSCIFLWKYISCVLTICGGRRYSAVGLSMCPSWYMDLTAWVTSSATCLVWFS